jgi:hypothetical protein
MVAMNWLATFPSTNAVICSGIGLSWATMIASWLGWHAPEGWLLFVAGCLGIGTAQFSAKRLTHKEPSK